MAPYFVVLGLAVLVLAAAPVIARRRQANESSTPDHAVDDPERRPGSEEQVAPPAPRLHGAVRSRKRLWVFGGVDHNSWPTGKWEPWWGEVLEFFAHNPGERPPGEAGIIAE